MSLRYLLDTNIISDLVRRPQSPVGRRIAELRYGAEKSGSKQLSERIGLLLSALETLPLEPPADRRYVEIRHRLARRGTPIGPNDPLIAAHVLAADLTLVTASTYEFERGPSPRVENGLLE